MANVIAESMKNPNQFYLHIRKHAEGAQVIVTAFLHSRGYPATAPGAAETLRAIANSAEEGAPIQWVFASSESLGGRPWLRIRPNLASAAYFIDGDLLYFQEYIKSSAQLIKRFSLIKAGQSDANSPLSCLVSDLTRLIQYLYLTVP